MKNPFSIFIKDISFRKKTILYTSMLLYIFILLLGLLIFNRAVDILYAFHLFHYAFPCNALR